MMIQVMTAMTTIVVLEEEINRNAKNKTTHHLGEWFLLFCNRYVLFTARRSIYSMRTIFLIGGVVVIALCWFVFFTPEPQTHTLQDSSNELAFSYPDDFGLVYVHPVDWPPLLKEVENADFTCVNIGEEISPSGKTETVLIDGREYCKTTLSEGAAGSIYHQYVYVFREGTQTFTLSFSARMPQCVNYDSPMQEVCREEQQAFNPDKVIADIVSTLK